MTADPHPRPTSQLHTLTLAGFVLGGLAAGGYVVTDMAHAFHDGRIVEGRLTTLDRVQSPYATAAAPGARTADASADERP